MDTTSSTHSPSKPSTHNISITLEQAQKIVSKHHADHDQSTIATLTELKDQGYRYVSYTGGYSLGYLYNHLLLLAIITGSHTLNTKTYLIKLSAPAPSNSNPPRSYFLTVSLVPQEPAPIYHPNSLFIINQLISLIHVQTSIPIPHPTLDTSLTIIPYHYLLLCPSVPATHSSLSTLSSARKLHLLTPEQDFLIDLQLGVYLSQLHAIQNDWFGLPLPIEPADPSYSWQETFTLLLETLLRDLELKDQESLIPYEDVRRYLSRAIGFFLFDDVETPSLIWFTGTEDDVYITIPFSDESDSEAQPTPTIRTILPNFAHSLWGDPLLETVFMPPGPSTALLEGYVDGGGGPLIVFPRQKTKRIWYTVFLALLVLADYGVAAQGPGASVQARDETCFTEEKRIWAREMLKQCVEALKDAPCY